MYAPQERLLGDKPVRMASRRVLRLVVQVLLSGGFRWGLSSNPIHPINRSSPKPETVYNPEPQIAVNSTESKGAKGSRFGAFRILYSQRVLPLMI